METFTMNTKVEIEKLDKQLRKFRNRIIHHIWFQGVVNRKKAKKLYHSLRQCRESWIVKNPDWFHYEWNNGIATEFVKRYYPEHYEMYKSYKYEIQRCDVLRYMLLHRYGGLYVDMDYFCNRPFSASKIFNGKNAYFVQSPNGVIGQDDDHISNSLIYSKADNPFWRIVLLELEKQQEVPWYYSKHLTVMFTTGPGILNRLYYKYKNEYKIGSLEKELYHPYGITDVKLSLTGNEEVFSVHLGKGSWENADSKFLISLLRDWKFFVFIVAIFVCILIGIALQKHE